MTRFIQINGNRIDPSRVEAISPIYDGDWNGTAFPRSYCVVHMVGGGKITVYGERDLPAQIAKLVEEAGKP